MKRVYWRPNRISKRVLLLVGLATVTGTLAIENFPAHRASSGQDERLAAAELADRAFQSIRAARLQRGDRFDRQFDPAATGLIGDAMSAVTSLPAHLDAKQTSVNPNFAAAVVAMLDEAGVRRGDVVAVGYTGSFPAFNTCVFAAMETLGVTPLLIHSAASSQFGANRPDMMWLDMESILYDDGLISFRTQAATLGGFGDRARGMSDEAKTLLREGISRHGVPMLKVKTLRDSIEQRMALYNELAAGRPIRAYINVGGGAASIHGSEGREAFGGGLVDDFDLPAGSTDETTTPLDELDCVATRFVTQGIPVLQIGNAKQLARQFGLPVAPTQTPQVGEGRVYADAAPNRLLAAALLGVIAVCLRTYLWGDVWFRLSSRLRGLFSKRGESRGELQIAATPQADLPQVELMV